MFDPRASLMTATIVRACQCSFIPIELAFAKLKAFLRAARPRTFDHVCALIASAMDLFTPAVCRNFVRHCGWCVATELWQML